MKKIECIIRPERFETLKKQLIDHGVGGMTISDVRGFGRQTSRPDNYLILPKLKIDIYCNDDQVEELIETILTVCRRNELGDGKIAVLNVDEIVRVRTGERQTEAIL